MIRVLLDSVYWMGNYGWLNDVYKTLPTILYAILAVVGGAGTVYAIILGVNLAKSESDEKRRYAAYRIRNTLIGVAILLVLVLFINLALPAILRTFLRHGADWRWASESEQDAVNDYLDSINNSSGMLRPILALLS